MVIVQRDWRISVATRGSSATGQGTVLHFYEGFLRVLGREVSLCVVKADLELIVYARLDWNL